MPSQRFAINGLLVAGIYGAFVLGAGHLSGEIVELETHDARGGTMHTSLWIVERNGDLWLRAHRSDAGWLERLRLAPEVHMTRAETRQAFRAEIVEEALFVDRVQDAMREKYGRPFEFAESLQDGPVPVVRLVASTAGLTWNRSYP